MLDMRQQVRSTRLLIAIVIALMAFIPTAVAAGADVKYTITVPIAYLRAEPSLVAPTTLAVAKGEFYRVTARTADNAWVRLGVLTRTVAGTWLPADLGVLYEGKLSTVPVIPQTAKVLPATRAVTYPKWIPVITPQMKAIYKQAARYSKDPQIFTVVGDCNSLPPVYLQRIATGMFDASKYATLKPVVARFSGSFSRISLAVNGGFKTAAMMDPDWADHKLCATNDGPFPCEVWVSRASIVFIELGTGDQYEWRDFETHYRPLIEHALKKGALPVLVTKADDLEARNGAPSGYINDVIRRLAKEYGVPLMDLWLATRSLPNGGLLDEGDLDFHLSYAGMDAHLIATLQTLDAIMR